MSYGEVFGFIVGAEGLFDLDRDEARALALDEGYDEENVDDAIEEVYEDE